MDIKWLEDFIRVAELGHFSRAADARHISQSALSRRIKSLELWVGAELFDRSSQPIGLTQQGEDFMPTAKDIVTQSKLAQKTISSSTRIANTGIRVACLHTLALYFIPNLFADLRKQVGPFEISIVAETRTVEEYLTGLTTGSSDFFICYSHPSVPFEIDEENFPSVEIGTDRMVPFHSTHDVSELLDPEYRGTIPFLQYSYTSYMSHVVKSILDEAPFAPDLRPIYRASLAESLYTAAQEKLGLAWLPESLVQPDAARPGLERCHPSWTSELKIRAYRWAGNDMPIVNRVWDTLT